MISVEPFSRSLAAEIAPLAQACWDESTDIKGKACAFYGQRDFVVTPDIDAYEKLTDRLVVVTLREAEKLVGYAVGFLYSSMHYKNVIGGFGDSMYVQPDYRSHSVEMVERFEHEMAKLGAKIIGWPTPRGSFVHVALKARGFVADDLIMEKLCA